MKTLSDIIEAYILDIIKGSKNGFVYLRRMDLSFKFSCVPSQINYVLNTRFTLERGYLVESKRGGGGYVQIEKISASDIPSFLKKIECVSGEMTSIMGKKILERLGEEEIIKDRELAIIWQLIKDESLPIDDKKERNNIRASMMKNLMVFLAGKGGN